MQDAPESMARSAWERLCPEPNQVNLDKLDLTRHSRNQTGLGSPKFFKSASNPHGYRAQKHPTKIFCQRKAEFHHKGTKRSRLYRNNLLFRRNPVRILRRRGLNGVVRGQYGVRARKAVPHDPL